jgi:hypothetical protein
MKNMSDTIGIPLAFLAFCVITLWIVIGARGWWWLKLIVITTVAYLSVCLWFNLVSLEGWPTTAILPDKFEVRWIEAREPNKKTKNPGAIYVWILDVSGNPYAKPYILTLHNKAMSNNPRLYELPYSRPAHEQSEQIKNKIKSGSRFFGKLGQFKGVEGQSSDEGGTPLNGRGVPGAGIPGNNTEGTGQRGGGSLSGQQDWIFHELPPPSLPEKITQGG